ncbi:DUF4097 family beta strand repeat-containing protein [Actinomadura litoris]|uniref:DUF4097 family beta strand repeat protein n=1 Tax=Actinomadura litoris TaxID=2678616 RepID=A0A7K1KTH3_9ACTN|nr:DUF4097 family beta strand repeat-containing protein [Actinomadura litoris]MUN35335.1 DUF4097 family beta strand repeat protein [Actinomadura litoris]
MTIPPHRSPLLGAPLLLVLLAGCGASADDASPEHRDFGPVGSSLTITKDRGDLDIRPADVEGVQVTRRFDRWTLVGGGPSAKWGLSGDRLTLATDCGALTDCAVRYQVLVPRGTAVAIKGQNGTITAEGFTTPLRVHTTNGAIRVNGASAPLDLRSENGALHATATSSPQVSARTDSGKVALLFATPPQRVDVTTDNGDVKLTVPHATYKVTTETENGDVQENVPKDAAAPRSITTRTDNGSITLTTP